MEMLNKEQFAEFKEEASEIYLILEAARRVDGGPELVDAAQVAKNLDEALGNLSEHGLGSDLEQAKQVEAMIATVEQLLALKQKAMFNPIVTGLLRMATYRVTELENDWEIIVMDEVAALLRR